MAAAAMDDLADRFAPRGVTSAFIYTREAHPGENYREHTSMAGKRANAAALVAHCSLRRPVLIDDLAGTTHHAWGLLPNMTFIVARNQILYKAAWTEAADVEHALANILSYLPRVREERLRPVYTERVAWRPDRTPAFREGLERAGPQAVTDFYGKKPE
jgi:hypothetical protein